MKLNIPIYVESKVTAPGKPAEYTVRPLFFSGWQGRSPWLQKAINELVRDIREQLIELGKSLRHETLAAWGFHPSLETEKCEVRLEAGGQSATVKLLVVLMSAFGRRIAFSPSVPQAWFEVLPGESVPSRLAEALSTCLKQQEREAGSLTMTVLRDLSLSGSAWVSEVEVSIRPPRVRSKPKQDLFAFLGSQETMDGEEELHKVGRCLNQLYPDDLDRVQRREREVAELSRLLAGDDKRPVLLLGPRQVGKTAIIHEHVFRQFDRHKNPQRDKEAVWLLSPQRLISGMSYVGEWESRLHAIVKHAVARKLVLCFDDVLGLFQAGQTSQSSLSVAAVLKPIIERREVRVLAEMTPEAFRVLRERDRGLADLFHILPVQELSGDDNLRVLIGAQRQFEARHRCRFAIESLPIVIDLQRRYARDTSFPGKGAAFLRRLAVKSEDSDQPISRDQVISVFHEQTGLPRSLLDQRETLAPDDVRRALRERFVGQPDAVQVAVEIVGLAKSRLNDPDRPIASLLLLGPTGVGKTQFAKSLAAYLFGSDERLLRFDMNEYVSPNAVSQLVGTFGQPEGLLTSAVRRQPFAVLLFDEIEKAHPDVFDLLLQVLGEGRLTDALGRTADFTNTIIVLTSNLGAQRSATGLGFGSRDEDLQRVAVRAAENFFRPEFFNRLDRVIPFERIAREDLQQIARLLIDGVLRREGLVRRQCVLNIAPESLDWIIEQGHDPALGARALKRAIERELTRPIATHLAAVGSPPPDKWEGVTLIDLKRGERGLSVTVQDIRQRRSTVGVESIDVSAQLSDCQTQLAALRAKLPTLRPAGSLMSSPATPAQSRYFIVQEECLQLATLLEELSLAERSLSESERSGLRPPSAGHTVKPGWDGARRLKPRSRSVAAREFDADDEIDEFLTDQHLPQLTREVDLQRELAEMRHRLRWLTALVESDGDQLAQQVIVRLTLLDRLRTEVLDPFVARYFEVWSTEIGLESRRASELETTEAERVLIVSGLLAQRFVTAEVGYHLLCSSAGGSPRLLVVSAGPSRSDLIREYTEIDGSVTLPDIRSLRDAAWTLECGASTPVPLE